MASKGANGGNEFEHFAFLYPIRSTANKYLPAARLANIVAGKTTRAFIGYVHHCALQFKLQTEEDGLRGKLSVAVREVQTASNRLLRAIEYLDSRDDKEFVASRFFSLTQDYPKTEWTESQWTSYFASVHQTTLRRAMIKDRWLVTNAPLDDFRRRLEALKDAAEIASVRRVPKLKENRTKTFIKQILQAVDMFGGELGYNKNKHTGTLAEVYDLFRAMMPDGTWTDLSPATLDRLHQPYKLRRRP